MVLPAGEIVHLHVGYGSRGRQVESCCVKYKPSLKEKEANTPLLLHAES